MTNTPADILTKERFLIVDNAIDISENIRTSLNQILAINELNEGDFRYDYVKATAADVFEKILQHSHILVSTTFTTIKSNAIEDLIFAGVKHGVKDKNIYSIMQFSIVGSDFEYFKPELKLLADNNVHFWFLSDGLTSFEKYLL